MKRSFIVLSLFFFFFISVHHAYGYGLPTKCSGPLAEFGYEKRLLPLPEEKTLDGTRACSSMEFKVCGRNEACVVPKRIVMHTTVGFTTAEATYEFFGNGGADQIGTGCHFVIGQDGKVIQMVEMLQGKVEYARCVGNYSDHISIELGAPGIYNSESEVPEVQYEAALTLVKKLMSTYNIPLGNLEYDWKAKSNTDIQEDMGVFGHYQLNPDTKKDPGVGFMKDFREDLKASTPSTPTTSSPFGSTTGCWVTKVGNPTVSPPLCNTGSSGNSDVIGWTEQIVETLEPGLWGYYNKMQADITNGTYAAVKRQGLNVGTTPSGIYWCTFLVVDSYNLAGYKGLGPDEWAVVNMAKFFGRTPGYSLNEYPATGGKESLDIVTPGDAIFFEQVRDIHTGHEHTAIIKAKDIDSRGNGTLETYDSNNAKTVIVYPVDNWRVKGVPYTLIGFGKKVSE